MQFNVQYVPYKIQFYGEGSVFLNDTALIFKGSVRKFYIPFLQVFYKNVILVNTIRTVPYSTILDYKKTNLLGNCYQIDYRLPDGKKTGIKFIIKPKKSKNKSKNEKAFLIKLEEYMTAIKKI